MLLWGLPLRTFSGVPSTDGLECFLLVATVASMDETLAFASQVIDLIVSPWNQHAIDHACL